MRKELQGDITEPLTVDGKLTVRGAVQGGLVVTSTGDLTIFGALSGPVHIHAEGELVVWGAVAADLDIEELGAIMVFGAFHANVPTSEKRLVLVCEGSVVMTSVVSADGTLRDPLPEENLTTNPDNVFRLYRDESGLRLGSIQ